jgi:uncharacterized protein YggU (UPF0235/DUF167 family)
MSVQILQIKVRPRSAVSALVQSEDGQWTATLKSAPVDGKANAELIALVARQLQCPRSAITIKSGAAGRMKLVQISR